MKFNEILKIRRKKSKKQIYQNIKFSICADAEKKN